LRWAILLAASLAALAQGGPRGAALGGLALGLSALCRPSTLPAAALLAAAAMLAGDTNGGGMPQIPRGVAALPYPVTIGVLAAIAVAVLVTE